MLTLDPTDKKYCYNKMFGFPRKHENKNAVSKKFELQKTYRPKKLENDIIVVMKRDMTGRHLKKEPSLSHSQRCYACS